MVSLLVGEPVGEGKVEFPKGWHAIAEAIDEPLRFPFLVEAIHKAEKNDALRHALIRVEIDCNLRSREDVEVYNMRLYVARTIETFLFGDVLLEAGFHDDDDDDGD